MQIANIYPIANQSLYKDEKYVMILAHLVKKGLYKSENFSDDQYIIMDNGLFEGEQVSTNLEDLVKLAKESGIPVKEIIVPDVINDCDATKRLFRENLKVIERYNKEFRFMFVAQALTPSELRSNILFINQFAEQGLRLSVGISKLSPLRRDAMQALQCYKHCKFPVHILGIKDSFSELEKIATVENVRGCDTSQLAFIAKNEQRVPIFTWEYSRRLRREYFEERGEPNKVQDIQLEHDVCEEDTLKDLKALFIEEAEFHGIL